MELSTSSHDLCERGAPLVVGFGQAGGKFTGCASYDGGPLSLSVATGDLNGDGATDIVSGNFVDPGSVTVLLATPYLQYSATVDVYTPHLNGVFLPTVIVNE